jgi:hypothetical protein
MEVRASGRRVANTGVVRDDDDVMVEGEGDEV